MTAQPPPEIAAAAAKVQSWLNDQAQAQPLAKLSESEFAALSLRDRFAYARQHDQKPFQPNQSPR
jgi:hypothetical protein